MSTPAAPTNVTLATGLKSLTVAWTNSVTAGATHTVWRSRGACGAFVAIAVAQMGSYIDYNVSNGETYAYYVVANVGTTSSAASATVTATFVGPVDQYKDVLTSADALSDRKGAVAVYSGQTTAGCGEYQRLLRLRGQATLCGK